MRPDFKTMMKWTLSLPHLRRLFALPPAKANLTIEEQESREIYFQDIVNEIADKMVKDFRNENIGNYRFLKAVNAAMIVIGFVLLGIAIILALVDNNPSFAAAVGGVAVADFIAAFIVAPQARMTGLLKDFSQFELIFASWSMHIKIAFEQYMRSDFSDLAVKNFQDSLEKYTDGAIRNIETNIGKE